MYNYLWYVNYFPLPDRSTKPTSKSWCGQNSPTKHQAKASSVKSGDWIPHRCQYSQKGRHPTKQLHFTDLQDGPNEQAGAHTVIKIKKNNHMVMGAQIGSSNAKWRK